jgi:low affinity Fe/Cu permease
MQNECPDFKRLDRIELKLDKVAELLIAFARTEEKVIGLEDDKKEMMRSVDDIEHRIVALEQLVGLNTRTVDSVHKVVWVIMTAVLTAFVAYILSWTPAG